MTAHELATVVASIPTPVDHDGTLPRAYVGSVTPSTEGPWKWQVYFGLDGGRQRQWVGPVFAGGDRGVFRLAEALNARAGQ